jgi:aspartate aminotransferase
MMLSTLTANLRSSPIVEIFDKAADLQNQGADLVDLSTGEPDFDTPSHIREAGIQAIRDGDTRYTQTDGTSRLKKAVIEKFRRDNGLLFESSQIIVSSGAKPLLASAVQAVLNPGDEVILPTPLWASHLGMVESVGAKPVLVSITDTQFKLTPESFEQAISKKTRLLILCSPSNPTGAVYSATELKDLATILRRHPQLLVVSDDLYEHIVFDDARFATMASEAPDLADRILTVNGVSKCYAMTGWRIGFAGGPKWWADGIRALFSQTNGGPCSISQAAAVAALTGPQDFLQEWCAIYQRRGDLAQAGLEGISGLTTLSPQGAFYLFPECGGLIGRTRPDGKIINSSRDLAAYFLGTGTVVVPGSGFSCDPYFRMSIATSESKLKLGLKRIKNAVVALS